MMLKFNALLFVIFNVLSGFSQKTELKLYDTTKKNFYQDECILATYKITNRSNEDISVSRITVVRDSRGSNVANYTYVKPHASHASYPDSLPEYKLESRKWKIEDEEGLVIRKQSSILISQTINDCLLNSCSHKAKVLLLSTEGKLPPGKYSVHTGIVVNNGEVHELNHTIEVIPTEGEYGFLLGQWNEKMEEYRKGKGALYPFEPEPIYNFFDTTKNALARDRLMTRLPFYFKNEFELDQWIKYIPLIQEPNIMLQILIRLVDESHFNNGERLKNLGTSEFEFYKKMAKKIHEKNKTMAIAFVQYIVATNNQPKRYVNEDNKSVILYEKELTELLEIVK